VTDDPERLREEQAQRAEREEQRAHHSDSEPERRAHERRAQKAGYLQEKLEEQAEADDVQ
jgi:hypothetical protein